MGESGVADVAPISNGDMLRLAPGPAEVIDTVTAGRIYSDGNLVGSEDEMGIARRRVLSWVGNVVIAMVIDERGDLLADPEVVVEGLPRTIDGTDSFEDIIYDAALEAFEAMTAKQRRDENRIVQTVERAVRAEIRDFWGKKPLITALVTRV